MTKVQAIRKVLEANGGTADWATIYSQIGRYYKGAKASAHWQAGIRGVLYREIRNKRSFKKLEDGRYTVLVDGQCEHEYRMEFSDLIGSKNGLYKVRCCHCLGLGTLVNWL